LQHKLGQGQVFFLAGAFGYDLPANRDNQKRTRTERIIPDPYAPGHVAVLDAVLKQACGQGPAVLAEMPAGKDVEATCLTNSRHELVVLAINWESKPVECQLRLPAAGTSNWQGYRLQADGSYAASALRLTGGAGNLTLKPQEATLWHLVK
jgi:hypothetical protein